MTVVRSAYPVQVNELYQTEPWATRAVLRRLPPLVGFNVWEPCAGNHKMADVLREAGANVMTSDIAVYDRPHHQVFDFFSDEMKGYRAHFGAIITNPPYGPQNRLAAKFARLALERCDGWVALLLTAKFDFGKTRADLFADNRRFAFKVALTDRILWFPGTEGTEDHAWYVWEPAGLHLYRSPRLFYEGRDQL